MTGGVSRRAEEARVRASNVRLIRERDEARAEVERLKADREASELLIQKSGVSIDDGLHEAIASLQRRQAAFGELLAAAESLLCHLGPGGYLASPGKPKTRALQAAILKATEERT